MTPIEWYYARGNKQMGPVTAVELKRLAAAASPPRRSCLARRSDRMGARAERARPVRGRGQADRGRGNSLPTGRPLGQALAKDASGNPAPTSRPLRRARRAWHLADLLLDSLRFDFNARFIDTTARIFRTCGLYGLLLAMVVTAAFAVIVAIESNTLGGLLWGVMMLLLLAALQYVAGKSCDALIA